MNLQGSTSRDSMNYTQADAVRLLSAIFDGEQNIPWGTIQAVWGVNSMDAKAPVGGGEADDMEQQDEVSKKLAEALNVFRWQHGDERWWTREEWVAHDKLVEKIKASDKS